MGNQPTPSRKTLAAAIDRDLTAILRARWHDFSARRTETLDELARDRPEASAEDRIRGMLLDLLDPPDANGRRSLLKDRDRDDLGLLARWMFGEPQTIRILDAKEGVETTFTPASTKTKQRYTDINESLFGKHEGYAERAPRGGRGGPIWELRQWLIEQLLQLSKRRTHPPIERPGLVDQLAAGTVPREIEAKCCDLLQTSGTPLVLYGQPGTGKSALAARIATFVAPCALVIRWAVPFHLGDTGVYEFDLLTALEYLGVEGRGWSTAALEHALAHELRQQHDGVALVLDDVPQQTLERLLPDRVLFPVIVTSELAVPDQRCVEIGSYTPAEALVAARTAMPSAANPSLRTLTSNLGYLPLAIYQAGCLIAEGDLTVDDLNTCFAIDPVTGVQILDEIDPHTRGLLTVCKEALTAAALQPAADTILLRLVWLVDEPFWYDQAINYLRDGTDISRTACLSALKHLERLGVLTRSAGFVVMHQLTRTLLRGLTTARMFEVLDDFCLRLDTTTSTTSPIVIKVLDAHLTVGRFLQRHLPGLPYRVVTPGPSTLVLVAYPDTPDGQKQYWVLDSIDDPQQEDVLLGWSSTAGRHELPLNDAAATLCLIVVGTHILALKNYGLGSWNWNMDENQMDELELLPLTRDEEVIWSYPGVADQTVAHEPIHPSFPDASGTVLTACGVACKFPTAPDDQAGPPRCERCHDAKRRTEVARDLQRFGVAFKMLVEYLRPTDVPGDVAGDWLSLFCAIGWASHELGEHEDAVASFRVADVILSHAEAAPSTPTVKQWLIDSVDRSETQNIATG